MVRKIIIIFVIVLLFLAIVQQYIIPLLIDEEIIEKSEFIDNIENWHLFVSSIFAGLIIGLILNKKTRKTTIATLIIFLIIVGGYFGIKNVNFDWFKKSEQKINTDQMQNFDQPFFIFQDTLKALPGWNVIKHQFYLGNTIIILSSSNDLNYKKSWEAGNGRRFEMKPRNDGLYWGQIEIKHQVLDPNTRYQVKINNYKGGEKIIFYIK